MRYSLTVATLIAATNAVDMVQWDDWSSSWGGSGKKTNPFDMSSASGDLEIKSGMSFGGKSRDIHGYFGARRGRSRPYRPQAAQQQQKQFYAPQPQPQPQPLPLPQPVYQPQYQQQQHLQQQYQQQHQQHQHQQYQQQHQQQQQQQYFAPQNQFYVQDHYYAQEQYQPVQSPQYVPYGPSEHQLGPKRRWANDNFDLDGEGDLTDDEDDHYTGTSSISEHSHTHHDDSQHPHSHFYFPHGHEAGVEDHYIVTPDVSPSPTPVTPVTPVTPPTPGPPTTRKAICELISVGATAITGGFNLSETSDTNSLRIKGKILGLTANQNYGFHIHEFGDTRQNCGNTGGHWNPDGTNHGAFDAAERHAGDIKMVMAGADVSSGTDYDYTDGIATLFGLNSIAGRALVLHANEDDLGLGGDAESLLTGNTGPAIGCCVIKYSDNPLVLDD